MLTQIFHQLKAFVKVSNKYCKKKLILKNYKNKHKENDSKL